MDREGLVRAEADPIAVVGIESSHVGNVGMEHLDGEHHESSGDRLEVVMADLRRREADLVELRRVEAQLEVRLSRSRARLRRHDRELQLLYAQEANLDRQLAAMRRQEHRRDNRTFGLTNQWISDNDDIDEEGGEIVEEDDYDTEEGDDDSNRPYGAADHHAILDDHGDGGDNDDFEYFNNYAYIDGEDDDGEDDDDDDDDDIDDDDDDDDGDGDSNHLFYRANQFVDGADPGLLPLRLQQGREDGVPWFYEGRLGVDADADELDDSESDDGGGEGGPVYNREGLIDFYEEEADHREFMFHEDAEEFLPATEITWNVEARLEGYCQWGDDRFDKDRTALLSICHAIRLVDRRIIQSAVVISILCFAFLACRSTILYSLEPERTLLSGDDVMIKCSITFEEPQF